MRAVLLIYNYISTAAAITIICNYIQHFPNDINLVFMCRNLSEVTPYIRYIQLNETVKCFQEKLRWRLSKHISHGIQCKAVLRIGYYALEERILFVYVFIIIEYNVLNQH